MTKPQTPPETTSDPVATWQAEAKAAIARNESQKYDEQALADACAKLAEHLKTQAAVLATGLAERGFGAAETAGVATLGIALNAELSANPDGLGGRSTLGTSGKKTVATARTRVMGLRTSLGDKFQRRPERANLADFGRGEAVGDSAPAVLLGVRRFLKGAKQWPAMLAGAHITAADLAALKADEKALEAIPAQKASNANERTDDKTSRDAAAMAVRLCFDDLRAAARTAFALEDDADSRFRGIVALMPRAPERRTVAPAPVVTTEVEPEDAPKQA